MTHRVSGSVVLIGALAGGGSALGGVSPSMLANTCTGCHGTNGASVGSPVPTISGVNPEVWTEVMLSYKNDERPSSIMTRLAKGYTNDEIEIMAEYFAKKPFVRAKQDYEEAKAREGQKYHKKYCELCHEQGGRVSDEGGILAGQWTSYLRYAMDDYLSGRREMTKKMRRKVHKLRDAHGDEAIGDLLEYYASPQD